MYKPNILVALLGTALGTSICSTSMAGTYPLAYNVNIGLYNAKLYVGAQKKPVSALIDTGSANLNFISDKTKCDGCLHFKNKTLLNIAQSGIKQLYKDTFYVVHYGTGGGTLAAYTGKVGFDPSTQVPTTFSLYRSGVHVSNILGLAYQSIAAPSLYPLKPYFDTIVNHHKFKGFALAMCGQAGHSHIVIGLKSLLTNINPSHIKYAPIVVNKYYITMLNAIYGNQKNGTKKLIFSYSSPITKTAIVDSGTGGYIVLPHYDRNLVIKYIYEHTPKPVHTNLSNSFWYNNDCINKSLINFNKFPSLTFSLAKAGAPGKSIDIKLSPHDYINSGGCSANSAHLAFMAMNTAMKKKLPRKYLNDYPSLKVLGTPFLEHKLIIFDRDPRQNGDYGRIGFVTLNKQCKVKQ